MSDFKEKIFKVVRKIPKGKTATYKEVAVLTGRPRAWRAVGNVLSKNFNSEIPCHRVIRSNGKLGGYNRGVSKKKLLLKMEQVKTK
ncbi:MAG: Methylated-DNA/protein-cysteine methyltransferase [Microgenomates group bacterium GW2011_GWC1_41_8]|nr:MAG: Methylated-DNA/protein-cysteine methyltransferase [Microgenomates group bacterium GW2011_GWC1_41_8]